MASIRGTPYRERRTRIRRLVGQQAVEVDAADGRRSTIVPSKGAVALFQRVRRSRRQVEEVDQEVGPLSGQRDPGPGSNTGARSSPPSVPIWVIRP